MKKAIILNIICSLLIACGNKSRNEIESEMASGVVLVQNQGYYEVVLPNGASFYFTSYDKEKGFEGLTDEKDSVIQALSYGTGFFISSKGQIATNMHVVNGSLDTEDYNTIKSDLTSFIDTLEDYIKDGRKEMSKKYEELEGIRFLAAFDDDVSLEDFNRITEAMELLEKQIEEYDDAVRNMEHIHMEDTEIKYHNKVSIAYNDTYVIEAGDFIPCVITKSDKEHDLAIIELKDKKTPQDTHVFDMPEKDPLEEYDIMDNFSKMISEDKNSQLHMTSFNYGPLLARTESGIKSQFNIGSISQKSKDKVMYSIPALGGSSGSPVVNRKGELVAINYAGLQQTQNFNYGIRVKYLKKLMEQ